MRTIFGAGLALLAAIPVFAATAGTVTFASGSVTAERTPAASLAKGDVVQGEDNVITGDASRAQLEMIDGAKIALRPNSRVVIDEYVYAAATSAAITTSNDDSSVISLVKGGFRTITGAIGKEDPSNYEVRTAVGVLGVRGTDFSALQCLGDCDWAPGATAGAPIPDGLYLSVIEGSIAFSNEVANIVMVAGEFAFIPFDTRQPAPLDTAPPVFIDDTELRFDADDATVQAPTGFDVNLGTRRQPDPGAPNSGAPDPAGTNNSDGSTQGAPVQSIQGIDSDGTPIDLTPGGAPDPQNRSISYSTGSLGATITALSTTRDNSAAETQLDGGNNITGFVSGYPTRTGFDTANFDIGTATNVESGFDSMTVLRWGRWAGGTAAITLSDGSDASEDLDSQSLHWVSSPEWAAPPLMPITGVADYTLVGATSPTDNLGNTGVLGAATFSADFTSMSVSSTLVIDIGGATWMADGQGVIGAQVLLPAHLFQGNYAVTIGASGSGTGLFSGFFSEPGPTSDPSFPGGAGLTYSLQDQGGTTVSGAAAFGNP